MSQRLPEQLTTNPPAVGVVASSAPNATTLKNLSDSKLISFAIGQQKKSRFQKQREEKELKKKIDEEEAAKVYESFVESFQNPNPDNVKTFVRAGEKVPVAPFSQINSTNTTTSVKATTPAAAKVNTNVFAQDDDDDEDEKRKKEELQKKKNKEMDKFLSELKEKEERIAARSSYNRSSASAPSKDRHMGDSYEESKSKYDGYSGSGRSQEDLISSYGMEKGSFDNGDPNTTNLYVGNLNPSVTEEQLARLFGRYGEINSIKIMWPRSEEEKLKKRNCGFVSFKRRSDAEDAKDELLDMEFHGYKMYVCWGKAVKINHTQTPFFLLNKPPQADVPSSSGAKSTDYHSSKTSDSTKNSTLMSPVKAHAAAAPMKLPDLSNILKDEAIQALQQKELNKEKYIRQTMTSSDPRIYIKFPSDPEKQKLIDLLAKFVAADGDALEKVIQGREASNPQFAFLQDLTSEEAQYYRWRVYANIAEDEHARTWDEKPFQYTVGGVFIVPPQVPADIGSPSSAPGRPRANSDIYDEEDRYLQDRRKRDRSRSPDWSKSKRTRGRDRSGSFMSQSSSSEDSLSDSDSRYSDYDSDRGRNRSRSRSNSDDERDRDRDRDRDRRRDRSRSRDRNDRTRDRDRRDNRRRGRDYDNDEYQNMTGAQIERKRREAKAASGSNYRGPRLPKTEYNQWKEILSTLDLSRSAIKFAMGFAFDNIDYAIEIVEMLKNRLILEKEHSAAVKIAGLFLLSDILHNSALPIKHATDFKILIQSALPEIFEHLGAVYRSSGRMSALNVEDRVRKVLETWSDWSIFPLPYLQGLSTVFYLSESDFQDIETRLSKAKSDYAAASAVPSDDTETKVTTENERELEYWKKRAKNNGIFIPNNDIYNLAVKKKDNSKEEVLNSIFAIKIKVEAMEEYINKRYPKTNGSDWTAQIISSGGIDPNAMIYGGVGSEMFPAGSSTTEPIEPDGLAAEVQQKDGQGQMQDEEDDIDGVALDGLPLDGVAIADAAEEEEDIDGVPLDFNPSATQDTLNNMVVDDDDDDIDGIPLDYSAQPSATSAPVQPAGEINDEYDDDLDGVPMD